MRLAISGSLLVLIFILTLFGCGDSEKKDRISLAPGDQSKPSDKILPEGISISINRVVELRDDFTNLTAYKENLNNYEAVISVPEVVFKDIEVRRSFSAEVDKPDYQVLPKNSAQLTNRYYTLRERFNLWNKDLNKKTISYVVWKDKNKIGDLKLMLVPDVFIPYQKDPVTLRTLKLNSGKTDLANLVFEKGSRLNTQGAEVEIFAERVIALDAVIESYSETEIADPSFTGRSGGKFNLTAETALGKLHFNMRGTNGAKGSKGLSGERGVAGTPGETCTWESQWGWPEPRLVCTKKATSGSPGGKGLPGGNGKPGGTGGNSGFINVYIDSLTTKFDLTLTREPGKGGEGGDPGDGGLGGPGGAAGFDIPECNSQATAGADGPPGDPGLKGDNGKPGQLEKSSVIISGKVLF